MNGTASGNIFEKIAALDLPADTYVIVGDGVLAALGVHEWDSDVDFAVTDDVFEMLANRGWDQYYEFDKKVVKYDVYDVGVGFGEWTLKDLQSDAQIINGIPFISFAKLIKWKSKAGRPKDLRHIEMIKAYQKNH
jgi:hypothetical protein